MRHSLKPNALLVISLMIAGLPTTASPADISDINGIIDQCTKTHGYNPEPENQLGANKLGKNERVFLECVYTGISEKLIPRAMVPDDYKKLIASHKQMTNAVEKGETTRKERRTRVIEILTQIKVNESAETERRIQDLSAKRDQFLQQRERMLKRNPRMF